MIALQTRPTLRAFVPADGQALVHEHPAARTGLRGVGRRHPDDSLASCRRLARPDAQEGAPPRVRTGLGQGVIPEQVGRLQVFVRDRVVPTHERARRRVVDVRSCPPRPLMRAGEQADCLAPAVAAFDATGDAPLRPPQVPLGHPDEAWGGDGWSSGQRGTRLQAESHAGGDAAEGQGLAGPVGAGDGDLPAVGLPADRARLGGPREGTAPPDRTAPDRGEDQGAVVEPCPVAVLLGGEARCRPPWR
jgi:hypothetical protein